jgi:hypothetical protein
MTCIPLLVVLLNEGFFSACSIYLVGYGNTFALSVEAYIMGDLLYPYLHTYDQKRVPDESIAL